MDFLFSLFGMAVLVGCGWLCSVDRRAIDKKLVATGIALQVVFAVVALRTDWGMRGFDALARFFVKIISFTDEGSRFVFGPLTDVPNSGFIFAVQVLPPIIFFSSLMAVLYHIGLMGKIVGGMSALMARLMNVSGAESLSVAANVFVGQAEAPLAVRPFIAKMTQSELFTMMVGGMATISGGILAAYVAVLGGDDPAQRLFYAKHLLAASFMSAPAAIVFAKLLFPETELPETEGQTHVELPSAYDNVIEAAAVGAADGLKLAVNVGAMLLAFIALIAMLNYPLEALGRALDLAQPLNLSVLFGYLMAPLAWVAGVPWADAVTAGALIAEKVVFNEFIAYMHLADVADALQPKSIIVVTYALCGFANFGSIAVQIGSIGSIAPTRRSDLAALGIRSVVAGTLATVMTGIIAGALV